MTIWEAMQHTEQNGSPGASAEISAGGTDWSTIFIVGVANTIILYHFKNSFRLSISHTPDEDARQELIYVSAITALIPDLPPIPHSMKIQDPLSRTVYNENKFNPPRSETRNRFIFPPAPLLKTKKTKGILGTN